MKEKSITGKQLLEKWQLCPKCGGAGLVPPLLTSLYDIKTTPDICDLCNGKKVISRINGLPPV